jgi:hypothetical protein
VREKLVSLRYVPTFLNESTESAHRYPFLGSDEWRVVL